MDSVMDYLLLIILDLALVFVAIGVWFFFIGLRWRWRSRDSRPWAIAHGQVVSAEILTTRINFDIAPRPVLNYTYKVHDITYQGSRISYAPDTNRLADAQAILEKYPAGSAVIVFYDSNRPQDAVLELSGQPSNAALLVGAISALIGLLLTGLRLLLGNSLK